MEPDTESFNEELSLKGEAREPEEKSHSFSYYHDEKGEPIDPLLYHG